MNIPNLIFKNPRIEGGGSRTALAVEIVGTAPLIQNRFADKSIHQMLGKHMGQDSKKEAKKPREVVENAIQRNILGQVAIPSTAIKKSMLTAASGLKALSRAKTQMRISLFVHGASIPISYDSMTPRMDITRTSGISRTPDIRFRPQFDGWKAKFAVLYDEELTSTATVVDLINRAGAVGVGEWRPEKNGDFGTFRIGRVLDAAEGQLAMAACEPIIQPVAIPPWAMDMALDLNAINKMLHADEKDAPASDDEEAAE